VRLQVQIPVKVLFGSRKWYYCAANCQEFKINCCFPPFLFQGPGFWGSLE